LGNLRLPFFPSASSPLDILGLLNQRAQRIVGALVREERPSALPDVRVSGCASTAMRRDGWGIWLGRSVDVERCGCGRGERTQLSHVVEVFIPVIHPEVVLGWQRPRLQTPSVAHKIWFDLIEPGWMIHNREFMMNMGKRRKKYRSDVSIQAEQDGHAHPNNIFSWPWGMVAV